jgi:pheromone shutdown protein TraB
VKQVILAERPDSVCVELDHSALKAWKTPKPGKNGSGKGHKRQKGRVMIANLFLGSIKRRSPNSWGNCGGEMRQGIESAREVGPVWFWPTAVFRLHFCAFGGKLSFWKR